MLAIKILAGAVIGAAVGVLLGRARVCSGGQPEGSPAGCSAKPNLLASILACAVFGAAVAYALARP